MKNQIANHVKASVLAVALGLGAVSSAVFADAPSVTRIFREPRLTRGRYVNKLWYAEQNSAELNGGRKPLL